MLTIQDLDGCNNGSIRYYGRLLILEFNRLDGPKINAGTCRRFCPLGVMPFGCEVMCGSLARVIMEEPPCHQ